MRDDQQPARNALLDPWFDIVRGEVALDELAVSDAQKAVFLAGMGEMFQL